MIEDHKQTTLSPARSRLFLDRLSAILNTRRDAPIKRTRFIGADFFQWAEDSDFSAVEINSLFEKTGDSGAQFTGEFLCDACGEVKGFVASKTYVCALIADVKKGLQIWCDACRIHERAEEQKRRLAIYAQVEREREEKEDELSEEWIMQKGAGWEASFDELSEFLKDCPAHRLPSKLKAMPYHDFLETRYWRIIAREVKRAGKCSQCESADDLRAHHTSYRNHGHEHTEEGLADLVCLCDPCHKREHDITPAAGERSDQ